MASPARFSRSARKPRLESCPLYAGRHLASQQAPARLLPGHTLDPGFGVIAVLSTRRRGFAYAHLSSPHLTGAPAFSMTLTTGAFDPSRSWRFGASPCRATPKGRPSSSVQLRDAQGTGHLCACNPDHRAHHGRFAGGDRGLVVVPEPQSPRRSPGPPAPAPRRQDDPPRRGREEVAFMVETGSAYRSRRTVPAPACP